MPIAGGLVASSLPHLDYLVVFVMFRLAAICHGIRGRLARGSASSAHAEATAAMTRAPGGAGPDAGQVRSPLIGGANDFIAS